MAQTPEITSETQQAAQMSRAVDRLQNAVAQQRDLPPIADASRQLAVTSGGVDVRVSEMVELALADPAIVIRLLRLVNGSAYETRDRSDVLSMNRAITLLGHEQIREQASNLKTIAEQRKRHTPMVGLAIAQAIFAASVARNLLDTRNPMVSDEGAVTTILSHLPDILCAIHAPDEVCALRAVRLLKPRVYDSIFRELLGMETATFGREVIESWALPVKALDTISRSRQRLSPVMAARDWLPIAISLANDLSQITRIQSNGDRQQALMELVRRFGHVMDIDSPRLEGLLEQSAYEAIGLERSMGCPKDEQFVARLLTPVLQHIDGDEDFWSLRERLDITGVVARVMPKPRPSMYARQVTAIAKFEAHRQASDEADKTDRTHERLERVLKDIQAFLPHYYAAEDKGLYRKTESIPGEPLPRKPTRRERTVSRVGPFIFDGLRMAAGYEGVSLYLKHTENDFFFPAWITPEPAIFDKGHNISINDHDLISKASQNRVDAQIANSSIAKVLDRLPDWFRQQHPDCRSFVFLPLRTEDSLRGFIIAERKHPDNDGLSLESMEALRKIRDAFNAALDIAEKTVDVSSESESPIEEQQGEIVSTH
ncbi:MAG: HDOD domain-containing protein [Burkholderiaceae bacterium]